MRLCERGLCPFTVTILVSGLPTLLLGTLQASSVFITGPPGADQGEQKHPDLHLIDAVGILATHADHQKHF